MQNRQRKGAEPIGFLSLLVVYPRRKEGL